MLLFHRHCVCLIWLFLKQTMQYIFIYVYNKSKTCCYEYSYQLSVLCSSYHSIDIVAERVAGSDCYRT